MKLNTILLAGVLVVFATSTAVAGGNVPKVKTYVVTFSSSTKVGSLNLKAGDYRLQIEGNQATFTDVITAKSVTTDVKAVENSEKKFTKTIINTTTEGKADVVKDIELQGSTTKIDF